MNNTNLIGRPTKDPILKNVNGNTVTSFTLAVKRKNKDKDGNHQSDLNCDLGKNSGKFL